MTDPMLVTGNSAKDAFHSVPMSESTTTACLATCTLQPAAELADEAPAPGIDSPPPGIDHPASGSQPPFPRFPGETPRAFSAFITWFQLGHARSHQAVADKLGEGLPTVRNWASRYDWSDRLLAFNAGLLQQQTAALAEQQLKQAADWAARLNRFRDQEWNGAQKLLRVAECFLENFGDDDLSKMTLSHAARALRISSDIARSALAGLELPPAADPAMSPIQQQMLDALMRLTASVPSGVSPGAPAKTVGDDVRRLNSTETLGV
jgi:hypothetical protein